jgi:hypothetical protein
MIYLVYELGDQHVNRDDKIEIAAQVTVRSSGGNEMDSATYLTHGIKFPLSYRSDRAQSTSSIRIFLINGVKIRGLSLLHRTHPNA